MSTPELVLIFGIPAIIGFVTALFKGRNALMWAALCGVIPLLILVLPFLKSFPMTEDRSSYLTKFAIVIAAISIASYGFSAIRPSGNTDIETVKNSEIPDAQAVGMLLGEIPGTQNATIGSGISKIVGVDGTVEWGAFRPESHKDNPNVVLVQTTIKKTSDKGKNQTAKYQFLLNKSTKYVELNYFEVNGKPKSKLDATMALQLGMLP